MEASFSCKETVIKKYESYLNYKFICKFVKLFVSLYMIIIPQTPITESSFNRWKCHRLEVEDGEDSFHYYLIPLVDIDEDEIPELEYVPALYSSESGEFLDENENPIYTVRLFDEDLPEMTSEEEVEILYKILTKKDIFLK